MNTILIIAAFVAAITVFEIVQAIIAHEKVKDEIKLIEAKLRAEEARKSVAEAEKISQELKTKLADTLSTLTEEQLATYNRTFTEMQRPVTRYVPYLQSDVQYIPYPYGLQTWGTLI